MASAIQKKVISDIYDGVPPKNSVVQKRYMARVRWLD